MKERKVGDVRAERGIKINGKGRTLGENKACG